MNNTEPSIAYISSPVGTLQVIGTEQGISSVGFADDDMLEAQPSSLLEECSASVRECLVQLGEYFSGKRTEFSLMLDPHGTDFQRRVWDQLLHIPFGRTNSYMDLAHGLGDPKTIRAVGRANGSNPIAIIIPCHRVIGSNGDLVGYAGGLHRKRWLLEFESPSQQGELFA